MSKFADPSKYIKSWKSAADVARNVVAVRTIYPGFNHISRVGGLPSGRIITVHGPTHGSKSAFALGLIKSFVDAGHWAKLIDAEHSTPRDFMEQLLGDSLDNLPNFSLLEPKLYEDAMNEVDEFLEGVKSARKEFPELCSIVVVDSINKLVPEREYKAVLKGGGTEMGKKHQGRDRAGLNQVWLDHINPLLADAGCSFVIIAQERDLPPSPYPVASHKSVYVKGGECLKFDASMVIRVSRAAPVKPSPTSKEVLGYKYRIRLYKNKCGHMDGDYSEASFHMQLPDGVNNPGFDIERDTMEYAIELGIIEQKGAWFVLGEDKFQGKNAVISRLKTDQSFFDSLMDKIYAADVIELSEENEEHDKNFDNE